MPPITSLLSCTAPIDRFDCFSTRQKHHTKTYATGLVVASNKTVNRIATHVSPQRTNASSTSFSPDRNGIPINSTPNASRCFNNTTKPTGAVKGSSLLTTPSFAKLVSRFPNVGEFYDHIKRGYIWEQSHICDLYADEKSPTRSVSTSATKTPRPVSNSSR